jgi:ABC-type multidrug transport system ATPase subunit
VFGEDISEIDSDRLQELRNHWGMLFQQGALYSALTVFENIAQPMRELHVLPEELVRDAVLLKMNMVGLGPEHANKMPSDLSGGMVKRVALARALALEPKLLFLDEPTAGLDPDLSEAFVALIKSLHRELGLTVVMVTHDLDTLFALSTRIAVLAEKHVIALDRCATAESRSPVHQGVLPRRPRPPRAGSAGRKNINGALMENRSHALTTGFFTITLLIAAILYGLWFNRDRVERVPYVIATAQAIPGLNPQAPMRYRGLEVGRVGSIAFDPKVAGQILVTLNINTDAPITTTTFAALGYQGVTGIAFIALDDDKTGSPRCRPAPITGAHPAAPGLFDQIEKRGKEILAQTEEVTRRLNTLLSPRTRR